MKKIAAGIVAVIMLTVLFCACGRSDQSGNTDPKETPVALGYSLNQFGLKVNNSSILQKEYNYQDIDINGKCTELYGKNLGNEVKVAVVQGFYKSDLKNGDILIDSKTYDPDSFKNEIVYQDEEVIVYDISNVIYEDTLDERVGALGLTDDSAQAFEQMLNQCASDLNTLIVKNNPIQKRPSEIQEIKNNPAIQL